MAVGLTADAVLHAAPWTGGSRSVAGSSVKLVSPAALTAASSAAQKAFLLAISVLLGQNRFFLILGIGGKAAAASKVMKVQIGLSVFTVTPTMPCHKECMHYELYVSYCVTETICSKGSSEDPGILVQTRAP